MSEVTRLIDAAATGDSGASVALWPLVYDELRKLAAARMSAETPGHTLSATALVHEAYIRLVGPHDDLQWDNRGHFFVAAAEAMRRVLIDHARDKARQKRIGKRARVSFTDTIGIADDDPHLVLSLDEALERLAGEDAGAAEVAKLHLFAGLPINDVATALGVSRATAYRDWTFARAWLQDALEDTP